MAVQIAEKMWLASCYQNQNGTTSINRAFKSLVDQNDSKNHAVKIRGA